jgi:hypothetical protein
MASLSLLTKTALPIAVYYLSTELDKINGAGIWLMISLRVMYGLVIFIRLYVIIQTRLEIFKLDDTDLPLVRIDKEKPKKKKKKKATNGETAVKVVTVSDPIVEFEEIKVKEYDFREFAKLARNFFMEVTLSIAVQHFISKSIQSERMLYLYGIFVGPINMLENELIRLYFLKSTNPLTISRPFQTDVEKMSKLTTWSITEQVTKNLNEETSPVIEIKGRFEDRMKNARKLHK